MIPFQNKGDS